MMTHMTRTIRAHFDGRVIVPDEPVGLRPAEKLLVTIRAAPPAGQIDTDARNRALDRLLARKVPGARIPDDALRRENMYDD